MKDLYSFHVDQEDLFKYYEVVKGAYFKILERIGLGKSTVYTYASGGAFTDKYSHEFQTMIPNGEDTIHLCQQCGVAINEEIFTPGMECIECGGKDFTEEIASEVGNIFDLGTKFSQAFDLCYIDKAGQHRLVVMGCYGFGTSRAMGVVVEKFADGKGLNWPVQIAPYTVTLVGLDLDDGVVSDSAENLYEQLSKRGVEVLFDDRLEKSSGEKLVDADLLGIPLRIVVSPSTVKANYYELKKRDSEELVKIKSPQEIINFLSGEFNLPVD